jgi:hypothetical protein
MLCSTTDVGSVSSTAAQTSALSRHVHFGLGTTPAALGGPPGPLGRQLGGDDPFLTSTGPQPSHQVSIYYINFTIYYLTNLIQRGFPSPQEETFDLNISPPGSDGSLEGGAGPGSPPGHATGPATPTHRQRRPQKAGSRLAGSGDDVLQFFQFIEGTRQCSFCL